VVIIIATHCFFYATSNEVRRHCWTTLHTILGVDHVGCAFVDYFENDIGPKRASHQLQLVLKSKTVADDCALLILQQFETITSGQASPVLRGQALSRSMMISNINAVHILMKWRTTTSSKCSPHRTTSYGASYSYFLYWID